MFRFLETAKELERQGQKIIHLEKGEPEMGPPKGAIEAAKKAMDEGHNILTPSQGIAELRDAIAEDLRTEYGFRVDPRAVVEDLSVGEEQRVEILKALYRGVEILILDEPTAVLTPNETKDLFGNLRSCGAGRTSFISHKLDEVLEIADRITVLRRGRVVGETRPDDTSKAKLAEMMVGRPVLFRLEKPTVEIGEPVLRVRGLSGEGKLNGIDLEVRAGEILGVAGVEGNGQRELAESLIGLRTPASGTIELEGTSIGGRQVFDIRNAGVTTSRGLARAGSSEDDPVGEDIWVVRRRGVSDVRRFIKKTGSPPRA
jgi:ABC-type uncharacterized transport system ATPase subunit